MKKVSKDDIKKMNELYLDIGTYAGVAREVGFSPSTVKRYIVPNYKKIDETKIVRFNEELPDVDVKPFLCRNWGSLCILTSEEKVELPALWEEMAI